MLFTLIKSLTKAEKRNFKLFCSPSENLKYIQLYNVLEASEKYDEEIVLKKCPQIKRQQIPNLKSQLYYQILKSLSQLYVNQNKVAQVRQAIDFSSYLLDKGLVGHAVRTLSKAKQEALEFQFYTIALQIIEILKSIELMHVGRSDISMVESLSEEANVVARKITQINALSNLSIQLSNLNLKLGYARSRKDKTLIISYFKKKLDSYNVAEMEFHEKLYYFQCYTWYFLIQYDFVNAYKWVKKLNDLFKQNQLLKIVYFDHYIRSISRLLDILFMTRRLSQMRRLINELEFEKDAFLPQNQRTEQAIGLTLLFGKINSHFLEGSFQEGVKLVGEVDSFIDKRGDMLLQHYKMLLNYKVACLYFGCQDYDNCIKYLQKIISVKDPKFRRDLQVFSRILNLIASYESGNDESLDKQIRSVYTFVAKTNDMHAVQKAIINFLRRLPHVYAGDIKAELTTLYNELKPLENDPYQRRPFFYLDIISWLESKIYNKPIVEIRRQKVNYR